MILVQVLRWDFDASKIENEVLTNDWDTTSMKLRKNSIYSKWMNEVVFVDK